MSQLYISWRKRCDICFDCFQKLTLILCLICIIERWDRWLYIYIYELLSSLKTVWNLNIKDPSDAFSRDINLPVCILNLGTHHPPSTQNTSNGDEMLLKTPQHTIYRARYNMSQCTIWSIIDPYEDFLSTDKRRRFKWYSHVSRCSGLSKTILQWTFLYCHSFPRSLRKLSITV